VNSFNTSIKFINHASVLIRHNAIFLLSDPWYFGTSFHEGWSLIYENKDSEIRKLLNEVTHIWISHEHPDHFSIPFFKKYNEILKENKIEILFQRTKDRRVYSFLTSQNLKIKELNHSKDYYLDKDFKIKCVKSSFYDSSLLMEVNRKKIFNLNDCPIHDKKQIKKFYNKYGSCDILLTQFSYAAWKGGKSNKNWRIEAAQEKIETVKNQSNLLNTKIVIPFASFIRFSNINNHYLNDHINTPDKLLSKIGNEKFDLLFLKPNEEQDISNLKQNNESIEFWREQFNNLNDKELIIYDKVSSIDELNNAYQKYRNRIFKKNSYYLMYILSKIPTLGAFKKFIIKINDFKKNIECDLFAENLSLTNAAYDVSMDSKSLDFIFNNSFGFDTLTVNGCFEEGESGGFIKMTKTFAIENLNNIGIPFNLSILFRIDVILMFFKLLIKVISKLRPA